MGFLNTGGLPIPPYLIPAARLSERAINYDFPGFIDCNNFIGLGTSIVKTNKATGVVPASGASLSGVALRDGIGCDANFNSTGVWNCITSNTSLNGTLNPVNTQTRYDNVAYTTSSTTGTNAEFSVIVDNVVGQGSAGNGRIVGLNITNGGFGLPGFTGYSIGDTFTFDTNTITGGGTGQMVLTATANLIDGNGNPVGSPNNSNFIISFDNVLEAIFYIEVSQIHLNRIKAYKVNWSVENQYFEAATSGVGGDFTSQNYWNTFSSLAVQSRLSDTVINLPQINSLMYDPTGVNSGGFPEELRAIQPSPVEFNTLAYTGSKKFHASTT